jgi:L-ribulose-5-phosphate 4-epimerase
MSEVEADGVIQFQAIHRLWANQEHISFLEKYHKEMQKLQEIRAVMRKLDWIGQDEKRYHNTGFGNLSMRVAQGFLITPSQSSHLLTLKEEAYTWVYDSHIEQNTVYSLGLLLPSSESMTHAMLYRLSPEIRFILHGHVPSLWKNQNLKSTHPDIGYGTIAMAKEVEGLFSEHHIQSNEIFIMGGHTDGVILFGQDHEKLIQLMLQAQAGESAFS